MTLGQLQCHLEIGSFQLHYSLMGLLSYVCPVADRNIIMQCITITRITKMWHRHKVSECFDKNGAERLAGPSVATNLQFVKKHNICKMQWSEAQWNKIYFYFNFLSHQFLYSFHLLYLLIMCIQLVSLDFLNYF